MCAKKATSSSTSKPAGGGKRKTSTAEKNGTAPSKSAAKKPAATKTVNAAATSVERRLSNHDIGAVAGEIWGFLSTNGAQTVTAIKKSVAAPSDVVTAAIGWLAREDKLEFTTSGRTLKVSLKS